MILTSDRVRGVLEQRLGEAGLARFVDTEHSQFLDLDGEVFAEVVLNDASKLEDVRNVVNIVAEAVKSQGISLDSVVRALWEIVSVEYAGPSYSTDLMQQLTAEEFRVLLRSGARQHLIIVNVTWEAIELLKDGLALRDPNIPGGLPPGHVVREMVAPIVWKFVEKALSHGGTSYWDPVQYSRVELTATDMSFLLGKTTAFEELRQAISDAFGTATVDSFLSGLSVSGIKRISDFDAVLPQLSNMLGGAYRKGDTFSTSASDLYRRLDRTEQELLKKYYQGKVDQLRKDPRCASLAEKYRIDLELLDSS